MNSQWSSIEGFQPTVISPYKLGRPSRRFFIAAAGSMLVNGCMTRKKSTDTATLVWGKQGLNKGRFQKPRAIAIDRNDTLFIADKTGIIQSLDRDGNFIRSWRLPESKSGLPCGLSIDNDGNLLVADTHYFRVLTYTIEGQLLEKKTIGGTSGLKPGQFGFVTDVLQDPDNNYFVSEYGDYDRIQKFTGDGTFLYQWGGHGESKGEFLRPQSIGLDDNQHLWVADACNHRIQVFDVSDPARRPPPVVKTIGSKGTNPGQFRYPYGLQLDGQGHLYICEFGNHRIQKLTLNGEPVSSWGTVGKGPGQLHQPWGIGLDSLGSIHVLDTYNHRVQRFRV